jgi:hypothetical protein
MDSKIKVFLFLVLIGLVLVGCSIFFFVTIDPCFPLKSIIGGLLCLFLAWGSFNGSLSALICDHDDGRDYKN